MHSQPNDARTETQQHDGVPRRTVLATAGAIGAGALLASCAGSQTSTGEGGSAPAGSGSPSQDASVDEPTNTDVLVSATDVPVGGAVFLQSRGVVVTQPTEGAFKAFDARCPHQGCMVSDTQSEDLLCPCHGSLFSPDTGEVLRGPARSGLSEIPVKASDGQIVGA